MISKDIEYEIEERAAIKEFDGNIPRKQAEREARLEVAQRLVAEREREKKDK